MSPLPDTTTTRRRRIAQTQMRRKKKKFQLRSFDLEARMQQITSRLRNLLVCTVGFKS